MSSLNQIRDVLAETAKDKTVIVCIGNTLKGDDGAAIALYEKLVGQISAGLINAGTVPESYIQRIAKMSPACVLLIDAVDFGGSPGEIKVFAAQEIPEIASSTHVMSLRFFADMLRQQSEAKILLAGIQPEKLSLGMKLSDSVSKTVSELAELLMEVFPPV